MTDAAVSDFTGAFLDFVRTFTDSHPDVSVEDLVTLLLAGTFELAQQLVRKGGN